MASNKVRSRPRRTSSARNRTKAVRSGVGSWAEKPQKRRKLARSSRASAKRTSERSCQVASRSARNRASGGQPGSPLVEDEISASKRSSSAQSTSLATSSRDVAPRRSSPPTDSCSCPIRRRAISRPPEGDKLIRSWATTRLNSTKASAHSSHQSLRVVLVLLGNRGEAADVAEHYGQRAI